MTTFPLGIMLANSVITEEEYRAGCRFAWLHARVIGKASLGAIDFERTQGRGLEVIDEKRDEELQVSFRNSMSAFESRRQQDEIVGLCVYDRAPRFLRPSIPTARDIKQGQIIKGGLGILADEYGFIDYAESGRRRRIRERLKIA